MTSEDLVSGIQLERAIRAGQFPVGVFRTDLRGVCFAVNPRWCELSGLTEEQSLGLGWMSAIHPDDRERVAKAQAAALAEGRSLRVEFRLVRPDGHTTWVLSQAVGALNDEGEITGFVGTVTDIDARVRAEGALRESEERFRNLVELSPDFIAIHRDGLMQYVNAAGHTMMRSSQESDLLGHHILEFVLPEYQAVAVERMGSLQSGKSIALAEMEVRRCDGEIIWIETIASVTVWEGEPAVQLVARDVTERRQTAEAYRAVVENIRDAMWIMERGADGEWRPTFVNRSYLHRSHLNSPDEVLGLTFAELAERGLMRRAELQKSIARYNRVAEADGPAEFEVQMFWAGSEADFVTTMTPVRDAAGKCNRVVCWSRDISGRRQRERALAESEANYRAVVEGTSDAVWVMDKDAEGQYRVKMANPRTLTLLGVDFTQVIGKSLPEFLTKSAADAALARYHQAEASGEPIEYANVVDRPGVRIEVVTHLTPLYDENGNCYRIIGSSRDVTDRRRAEAALLQAQKLESLGVLAGGIAHDFNNLLTTILGNLYLLQGELPEGSPLSDYAADSKVAAERGADLVRRLLDFSRPGVASHDELSLELLFRETRSLVQRTLGPGVDLVFDTSAESDRAVGEFGALQQVLVNLFLNARDAMPEGGSIRVSRRVTELGREPIWVQRGLAPGRYHEILVADSGLGMSRDVVQRIFDPFFTTKGVGKGTGLGLSTSLSIIRAHGGWLEAESDEGAGSTFRLLLPAR
ncbi:MAG: PAS domain S-box protein [Dehalococcoidia bacterium]